MSVAEEVRRDPPGRLGGVPAWRFAAHGAAVLLLGRGAPPRDAVSWSRELLPAGVERAWLHQVHSARVLEAGRGACGDADALVSGEAGVALLVATADCVPVLLATPAGIAAVHAGWRGVAAGVVPAAVERLARRGALPEMVAWIGPAIGACCYEVGAEVAGAVAAASDASVVRNGPTGRPHVDLAAAVALQLSAAGAGRIVRLDHCTRCRAEWLWSHRGDGAGAGRNLALVWRAPAG